MTKHAKQLTILAYMLLSACVMVGPDYKKPKIKVTHHWKNNVHVKEKSANNASWWCAFHDKNLTTLIHEGYQQNLSLQSAGVRVLQARAQLAQTVGELFPQQQAIVGNYNYNRIGGGALQSLLPSSFETTTLGFTANWELDFWGKYRRAIRSNDANFLASFAAYDYALVTLTADIATAYIKIRTSEALIRITKANIQLQTTSLKIAQSRYRAGQTSLLDVQQAQTQLAETEGSLPPLISRLQTENDRLAVLLGKPPNAITCLLKPSHGIPKAPKNIAVGIPKEALAQRPDIHQARMEAIAQSESIGAIKANLFPSLSLSGTFAFATNNIGSNSISDIFQWSNRTITAGPAVNWSILNYGQITNAVRVQDAAFQQALLKYQNLVLTAQQEVQDNITRFIETQKSEQSLAKANRSAIQATKLAIIRYREGENDYTTVLYAEQQQLRVQKSLTNTQGEVPLALVALYRSLGGGWQIRNQNDIVPASIKKDMETRTNWSSLLSQNNHMPPITDWEQFKQRYIPNW